MHGQREFYGFKNFTFFIYFFYNCVFDKKVFNSCERGLGQMNTNRSAAQTHVIEVFKITDDKKCRWYKKQKKKNDWKKFLDLLKPEFLEAYGIMRFV